jgi:HD-GYP domain-containing protein (c-di-GMP phosphodiesterase class II)
MSILKSTQPNGRQDLGLFMLRLATHFTKSDPGSFRYVDWEAAIRRSPALLAKGSRRRGPGEVKDGREKSSPRFVSSPAPPSTSSVLAIPARLCRDLMGMFLISDWPEEQLNPDNQPLATLVAEKLSQVSQKFNRRERDSAPTLESIKTLISTLEDRDPFGGRHSTRVTQSVLRFARYLGLPPEDLASLEIAGYLHDLGKVAIGDAILLKAGSLTQAGRSIMETHPFLGEELVNPLGLKPQEKEVILHHHERWDGSGYPHGLAGEEIPLFCRLVALADTYDALTTRRSYRRPHSVPQALEEIGAYAGTQFDPDLARQFVEMTLSQAA